MWFCLLHVGTVVRLRNFVIPKKEGVSHGEGVGLRAQNLDFFVPLTLSALSCTELMEEMEFTYALYHYIPKILPK